MCVLLKVPRQKIKILEDMDPDEILTPSLECQTSGTNFLNVHSSLQFVFGDIERSVSKGESAVKILEDPKGWEGCSDLLVTFYAPSWARAEKCHNWPLFPRMRIYFIEGKTGPGFGNIFNDPEGYRTFTTCP